MNEFSEPMTISPTARKLAERYGVSPEVMEEIISDTRSRTEIPKPPTPLQQTVSTVPEAVGAIPTPAPVVANYVAVPPPVVAPVPIERKVEESSMSPVTVILSILLILALVGLIYLWQEQHPNSSKLASLDSARTTEPADTVHTVLQVDTVTPQVLAPAQPVVHHRARKRAANHGSYFTSSPISAQEHLAELRASGNHRAYLETVNRKGITFYRLHTGPKPKKRHIRS